MATLERLFQTLLFAVWLIPGLLMLTAGETALDFSSPNDEKKETATMNVISGSMLLYADLDLNQVSLLDIDEVVADTLGRICKHQQGPLQGQVAPVVTKRLLDINTFGQVRQGLNYSFTLLPENVPGGPKDCLDRLALMSYGPMEPPWNDLPKPPMRTVFAGSLHNNPGTSQLESSLWGMGIPILSCTPKEVILKQVVTATGALVQTSTMTPSEHCDGKPHGLSWDQTPDHQGFDPSKVSNCRLALDDPCICGSLPSCEWLPTTRQCMATPNPGVSCAACSWQRKCWAPNQDEKCSKLTTACACAAEKTGCAWVSGKCLGREGAGGQGVSCTDCASQARCSTPKITGLTPPPLSLMGADGWILQVAFDRPMEFNPVLAKTGNLGMLIRCRTYDGSPTPVFELDSTKVTLESSKLLINTKDLRSSKKQDCDVVIYASALLGKFDLIPYRGMQQGDYTIKLSDTVAPIVERLEPANSARGVLVNSTVSLYFTEKVRLGVVADAQKFSLVDLSGNGVSRESAEPHTIYMSDPRFTLHGAYVTLDLSGQLEHGRYYSLSLPPDALVDRDGNNFTGLESGYYTFETAAAGTLGKLQDDHSGLYVGLAVGASVLLLVSGMAFAGWQRFLNMRSSVKVLPKDGTSFKGRRTAPHIRTTGMRDLEAPEECVSPVSPVAALFKRADPRPYIMKLSGTHSSASPPQGRPPSASIDANTPELTGSRPTSSSVKGSTRSSRSQPRPVSAVSLSGSAAAAGTMSVLLKKSIQPAPANDSKSRKTAKMSASPPAAALAS